MDYICMKLSSGIAVAKDLTKSFNKFKLHNNPNKFIVFKIENKRSIVEEIQSEDNSFLNFLSNLPLDDCRYAVYKIDFTTLDERPHEKLIFISW